jgi:hypothetical protein
LNRGFLGFTRIGEEFKKLLGCLIKILSGFLINPRHSRNPRLETLFNVVLVQPEISQNTLEVIERSVARC